MSNKPFPHQFWRSLMEIEFISRLNFIFIGGYSRAHSQYDVSEEVEVYRNFYGLDG
jgi:hypothetical protein